MVYGMASFLFLSGILRNNRRLLTLTLIVGFLYGSMIWGFFPEFFPDKNISWEGHLFGFVSGLLLAIFFRKEGPEEEVFVWDDSDVPDDENSLSLNWALYYRKWTRWNHLRGACSLLALVLSIHYLLNYIGK